MQKRSRNAADGAVAPASAVKKVLAVNQNQPVQHEFRGTPFILGTERGVSHYVFSFHTDITAGCSFQGRVIGL